MSNENKQTKVLALKYRPRRFEDLVGQSTISQTLSLALDSNRLSHAYLFSGLRGSGKTSTARIMAKALLCSNGPTSKPCETCENCLSANASRHLDIIEMDAASNRGIDDIKDLIEHTKYKPSSARFKVFIIDEVHMLTTQAFNALLKTLEEPPGFVKFILATTDPLKLPATILSRTQHFRFNKIANTDVIHHLSHILNEENIEFETKALEVITRSGQGSLRDTLTLLDQAIIFSKGKITLATVVDMLGLIEPELMDKVFEIVLKKGDIRSLVQELESYEISQICDEMTIYLRQKMLDKDVKFDLLIFDRFFRILSDAKHLLALNSDGLFVLILTLSKMIEATNLKTIDEIINEVQEVEVKPTMKEPVSINKQTQVQAVQSVPTPVSKPEPISQATPQQLPEPQQQEQEQEPQQENEISLDSVDAIGVTKPIETVEQKIDLSTPFDEFATPFDEKPQDLQVSKETTTNEQVQEQMPQQEVVSQEVVPQEESQQIQAQQIQQQEPVYEEEMPQEQLVAEQVTQNYDANKDVYEKLINKVYERDVRLGELFEENFVYKAFENNKLQISSYAQGEERKFLLKHYGVIKLFIYDVFGENTEIEFIKEDPSTRAN